MDKVKKSILVIDDDMDFTNSVKVFLEGRGYAVETAGNGRSGLDKIVESRPDLIVLDIMMDFDAEGFNLAYRLRRQADTKMIPIIIVSGFAQFLREKMEQFQFVLGQDWPADSYMEKPVELKALAGKIDALLEAVSTDAQTYVEEEQERRYAFN